MIKVEIIANDQGNRTTPSWVAFNENEKLVGESAKSQVNLNPDNTVYDVKRLMGHKMNDPLVQKERLSIFHIRFQKVLMIYLVLK